tara:strand:+ start:3543 stop:4757 length:1215 start_codon:yes stop_codon:yes gene_type:complete
MGALGNIGAGLTAAAPGMMDMGKAYMEDERLKNIQDFKASEAGLDRDQSATQHSQTEARRAAEFTSTSEQRKLDAENTKLFRQRQAETQRQYHEERMEKLNQSAGDDLQELKRTDEFGQDRITGWRSTKGDIYDIDMKLIGGPLFDAQNEPNPDPDPDAQNKPDPDIATKPPPSQSARPETREELENAFAKASNFKKDWRDSPVTMDYIKSKTDKKIIDQGWSPYEEIAPEVVPEAVPEVAPEVAPGVAPGAKIALGELAAVVPEVSITSNSVSEKSMIDALKASQTTEESLLKKFPEPGPGIADFTVGDAVNLGGEMVDEVTDWGRSTSASIRDSAFSKEQRAQRGAQEAINFQKTLKATGKIQANPSLNKWLKSATEEDIAALPDSIDPLVKKWLLEKLALN